MNGYMLDGPFANSVFVLEFDPPPDWLIIFDRCPGCHNHHHGPPDMYPTPPTKGHLYRLLGIEDAEVAKYQYGEDLPDPAAFVEDLVTA